MRQLYRIISLVICVAVLAACGSDANDDVDIPATPAATPTAVPQMTHGQIIWTDSTDPETGAPGAAVERYSTDAPAIIAVFEVTDVPEGTTFTAEWTINGAPIEGATMRVQSDNELPHGWITFRFTREDGHRYPLGDLAVKVTVSSGETLESWVEIAFP